jgi:flagellar L-ring protein precursor FlgH
MKYISICGIALALLFSTSAFGQAAGKPVAETKTPSGSGSLWNPVRTRMLVGLEGNSRRVGDLVTVNIDERTSSQIMAETQTVKESKAGYSVGALFGLKQDIVNANPNLGGNIEMNTSGSSSYNGDGNTSREGVVRGQITCRVVEVREDTGNLVVFGWKEVRANRETQYLSLSGVVRPQDIRNDNTISSQVMAEAKIEFTGSGVVSDKQGPGFGTRLIDHVWPF